MVGKAKSEENCNMKKNYYYDLWLFKFNQYIAFLFIIYIYAYFLKVKKSFFFTIVF